MKNNTVDRALAESIIQNYLDRAERHGAQPDTEQYLRIVEERIAEWRKRYLQHMREDLF